MRILVFGGTRFVGRHLVETAVARGHKLTLFNRGLENPGLFKSLEQRHGDRTDDLKRLDDGAWDAVLDVSGYFPRVVRASATYLKDRVPYYGFISTVSVYADRRPEMVTEAHEVGTIADPTVEERNTPAYGPLKALCEDAVREVYPKKALIIRPGLVCGPYDPTNRFTYWTRRIAEGGHVLAPEPKDRPVQFIDARDLARFTLSMMERHETGTYNATGPDRPLSMAEFLEACRVATGGTPNLTWVSEEFLVASGVVPYTEMPVWLPNHAGHPSVSRVSIDKGLSKGLEIRKLAETIRDTLAWELAEPDPGRGKALTRGREAELLREWKAKQAH
ncbi:MAG: NAD-dependent epimerase/dehydratase family protein [Proteobacteria bacterium]|nr:NAD-dependent epimerase/dehydratase family protein [Pseudomonadota bacterium]MBI3499850.1 NAD-dependent epimerase/dehydratase family protein [Pseudomonadota bacterium]